MASGRWATGTSPKEPRISVISFAALKNAVDRAVAEAARAQGADPDRADRIVVDAFAHAIGLLLLDHTGRIRLFRVTAHDLMAGHVDALARRLTAAQTQPGPSP